MEDKKYSVLELTEKLIGVIEPIASSEHDIICSENIEVYKSVVHGMISKLIYVSRSSGSTFASQAKVGKEAKRILKSLRDEINESL